MSGREDGLNAVLFTGTRRMGITDERRGVL